MLSPRPKYWRGHVSLSSPESLSIALYKSLKLLGKLIKLLKENVHFAGQLTVIPVLI